MSGSTQRTRDGWGAMIRDFVALSFLPDLDASLRRRLHRAAEVAFERRTGSRPVTCVDTDELVVIADRAATAGETVALTRLDAEHAARVLAPGARLRFDAESATLETDLVALKHLFLRRAEGWAAASTSALVLGSLAAPRLDPDAWAAAALTGFLADRMCVVAGVERLAAGTALRLFRGGATTEQRTSFTGPVPPASASGGEVIREIVADQLATSPDAGLELSGGLDSRLILAAITKGQRRGRLAMTIGEPSDPDVVVAARLAADHDLEHHVLLPLDRSPAPPEALRDVLASGLARDHASDALAAHVLDDVERRAPAGPRFTGANGEFARGFYYPSTPRRGPVTPRRVEYLGRIRLFTNHRAASWIFAPGWLEDRRAAHLQEVETRLRELGSSWRPATDEYYLAERMPNWAGPGYSHMSTQRQVLAPFLHPAFLAWSRRIPPSMRAGSRAMASSLCELDRGLGDLPLDSGLTPRQMADGGPSASIARTRLFAHKAVGKVEQMARGTRRPARGAALLVAPVARALAALDLRRELSAATFLSEDAFTRIQRDPASLDQPTVSYLVNLIGTLRFLSDVTASAASDVPPRNASG